MIPLILILLSSTAHAASGFHLEVLEITGEAQYGPSFGDTRPLAKGNLIPHGYVVNVPDGSSVDLVFDPEWKNLMRITGPASITVHSVFPTEIQLEYGDVYSILPSLPRYTYHEIRTPFGVATVHGSEYRVVHRQMTTVSNFSASPVFVFGKKADLELFRNPLILKDNRIVRIEGFGILPSDDTLMNKNELASGLKLRAMMKQQAETAAGSSRTGKTDALIRDKAVCSLCS
ncbi:MAG: hypothetical protein KC649_01070 [Candidatus Omnitrophica bacterium]|nr:hypothetical protein [Candidatus Omnitrophota bacterium]